MAERGEREPLLGNQDGDNQGRRSSVASETQQDRRHGDRFQIGRFTLLEKILFILSVTLLILLCIFVGLYTRRAYGDDNDHAGEPSRPSPTPGKPDHGGGNETERSVCVSAECVLTAAEILKDIDTTVDPCDDFYAYTCNNWIKSHDIPEGKSRTGSFDLLATRNKEILHSIFTHDFDAYNDIVSLDDLPDPDKYLDKQNFQKGKAVFDSCMDESAIDSLGADPLLPLLRELIKIFPNGELYTVADGEETFDIEATTMVNQKELTRALVHLSKVAVDPLFALFVEADSKDPEVTSLQIFQSGLTLPSKEYYKQKDMVDTLREVIEETLNLVLPNVPELGWSNNSAKIMARMIVDFEKQLAEISDLPEDLMDPSKIYNPRTLSNLTKLSPSIDWGLLVTHMLPDSVPHQDTIVVSSPRYLDALSNQLINRSTQRTLQAYLLWQAINEYAPSLSEQIRKPLQRLSAKLRGTNAKVTKPRWETCLDQVDLSLGFLASRYFVLETFKRETKARADEFVASIKDSFLNRLPELEWLDQVTRDRAIEKAHALAHKVGYPTKTPNVMSPVSLSDYYSDLSVDQDDYFGNYLRGRQWLVMKNWKQAGKPTDKSTWEMTPSTVNAYFDPSKNQIVFPAGILQAPFFSGEYPDYLNYGGIGAVVGHELSHSYDNNGRHFDARGRLSEWWTKETLEAFEEKTKCFVNQYSNFTMDDEEGNPINVNGKLTLGENIADNGGVRQSYVAWKKVYDKNQNSKENMLLPGLENITPQQLFFINYGRIWCGKSTKAQAKQSILVDEHSPPKWRVIGALQNSKYFADVFKCPAGSPMNPIDKCDLW